MKTHEHAARLGGQSVDAAQTAASSGGRRRAPDPVSFDRAELNRILNVYGQFVAAGEWCDYAIDHLKDAAVFSIFRRTSEAPLYRIEKRPSLARRQGAWAVVAMTGAILKRGHDLGQVLRVFDKQRLKLAD
ncbi:MAG: DUF2794 domain-containing protein [Pseudomonadota bacterium]